MFDVQKWLDPKVYDRIMTAADHAEPDRVPIWDFIDNRAILDHLSPGETDLLKANVALYHGLGIDLCRGFVDTFAPTDDGRRTAHGQVGGQTDWQTDFPIRTLDDLEAYPLPTTDRETLFEEWIQPMRRYAEAFAPATMFVPGWGCGFHAILHNVMGLELFSLAIYDRPEALMRLLDGYNRQAVAVAERVAEERIAPLFFIGDDIAYKERLMFSPAYLRTTCIPMIARMCEPLRRAGIKPIFHSDGNVSLILDDLVEAGIAGLNPIEPIAGMDIGQIKQRYGRRLILVGNVDCSHVLPLGSPQEVIAATRQCLRVAGPGGGLFIGSSSEITPSTPVENILTFYETCHTDGRYPIRC